VNLATGVPVVACAEHLIPSTARQILVHRALRQQPPVYGHVPLVVGTDGKRLAKRFGEAQIATLRAKGISPERIIGVLAEWSGLGVGDATPRCLVPKWSWDRVVRERIVLGPERLAALR